MADSAIIREYVHQSVHIILITLNNIRAYFGNAHLFVRLGSTGACPSSGVLSLYNPRSINIHANPQIQHLQYRLTDMKTVISRADQLQVCRKTYT